MYTHEYNTYVYNRGKSEETEREIERKRENAYVNEEFIYIHALLWV